MSWKSTVGVMLAATFAVASASLFAQTCQGGSCIQQEGDWTVETTPNSVHAFTGSAAGGVLSYMCMAGKPGCQWAVIMPEANCAPGSREGVSLAGEGGSLAIDALCKSLPRLNGMPGAGRVLMFSGPEQLLTQAVVGRDVTVSTHNTNRRVIQHAFSGHGSSLAVGTAYNAHNPSSSPRMVVREREVQKCITSVLEAPPNPGLEVAESFCRCLARQMDGEVLTDSAQLKAKARKAMRVCEERATQQTPAQPPPVSLYPPRGTYIGEAEKVLNESRGVRGR